jgi:very-short-patch-repair endonuclease
MIFFSPCSPWLPLRPPVGVSLVRSYKGEGWGEGHPAAGKDNEQEEGLTNRPDPRVSSELRQRAREFRRNLTPAEKILWNCVRDRQLDGHKIRRQYVVGPFIADFCCVEKQLIIEIDGSTHEGSEDYDGYRTEWLNRKGWRVIRFSNTEVYEALEDALSRIWLALQEGENENNDSI